jgi:hypothetical protein
MKTYWGVEVKLHAFLTSALDGGEWSASLPDRFTPRERTPGTNWIGGWVGPRAILDALVKRKIPSPRRESNPKHLYLTAENMEITNIIQIFLFMFYEVIHDFLLIITAYPTSHCLVQK